MKTNLNIRVDKSVKKWGGKYF